MSLLEIKELTHTYGDKTLYKKAELCLNKGEHMGIVGQNGAGKSTLISIMTGKIVPDGGQLHWQPGITTGHMDQYVEIDQNLTIRQFLKMAFAHLYQLENEMNGCYQDYSESGKETMLNRASYLQEQLESADFYTIEQELGRVCLGLGIQAYGLSCPIRELSGGQRAKVILAKLLLEKADVLLLDEPTNFLDSDHIRWLAEYLKSFPGAWAVVSHDFQFLEEIAGCICDIEFGTIKKYHGSYSAFLKQKAHLRQDYIRQYEAQQKEIKRTEEFIRRNKAGIKTKMARGRQKQLDRLERIEAPNFTHRPTILFTELPISGNTALSVTQLMIGYDVPLLPKISFSISGGQKFVITGFNGIGKSTLLKTLCGLLSPLSGHYAFSDLVQIGYYDQDLTWDNHLLTPIQAVSNRFPNLNVKQIRKHLARCGVLADSVSQPLFTLSGGEQSKVKLCLLTLTPCNFLILDEPTNHLDQTAKEELKTALKQFPGSLLLVSHEESFYRGWTDRTLHLKSSF